MFSLLLFNSLVFKTDSKTLKIKRFVGRISVDRMVCPVKMSRNTEKYKLQEMAEKGLIKRKLISYLH